MGAAGDRISDEPIINAVYRRGAEILFGIYAFGMTYLSFVPFDFRSAHVPAARSMMGLPYAGFNMPDVLGNIGTYLPFGAFAYFVARRRRMGCVTAGLAAVMGITALSYSIEWGQQFVVSRVSSCVDTVCNALGAALGVFLAVTWEDVILEQVRAAQREIRYRTPFAFAKILICAVILIQLLPYDLVVDPIHTVYALRHADRSPLAQWRQLESNAETARTGQHADERLAVICVRRQWDYALNRVVEICCFAAITAAIVVANAVSGRRRSLGLALWSGFVALSTAFWIVMVRVLMASFGLDTATLICGLIGWPIGCTVGFVVVGRRADRDNYALPTASLMKCLQCAAVVGVMLVVVFELSPFDYWKPHGPGIESAGFNLIPFFMQFQRRANAAIDDISGKVIRYFVVGAAIVVWSSRQPQASWRWRSLMTIWATALAAAASQFLHLWSLSRGSDVTTILLAIGGSSLAVVGIRLGQDYYHARIRRFAWDPLTAALTSSARRDVTPISRPRSRRSGASPRARAESTEPD